MKRLFPALSACLLLCLAASLPAAAQVRGFAIGPKAGIYLDKGKFMVGAVGEFPFTPNLYFEPGLELVSGIVNTTRIIIDANARYTFPLQGLTIEPFVLGGFGMKVDLYDTGNDTFTDTGFRLNIGGGTVFNSRGLVQPWGGLKIYLLEEADSDVLLQVGVNFFL